MAFEPNNEEEFSFDGDFVSDTKIVVFGVGGGGGNAVASMVESNVGDVSYVVANTDVKALINKDASKMKRIQLGRETTRGRGAGNNPLVGAACAKENRKDIEQELDGAAMVFIAAGMGGGTGTGAAPIVAQAAKEKDILTVGVVTKPFNYEGASKMNQALKGIQEMRQYVDALIVIPNERINDISDEKLTVKSAFKMVDSVLCKAVLGIITLLNGEGYVNVDFADICMALRQSGIAHMAIGHGKGENKCKNAVDEVLHSPLLETSIDGARRGLLNISIPQSFPLDEYEQLVSEISARFNADAEFKAGVVFDDSLGDDEVTVIAIATDFGDEMDDIIMNSRPAEDRPAAPAANTAAAPASSTVPAPASGGDDNINDLLNLLNSYKN